MTLVSTKPQFSVEPLIEEEAFVSLLVENLDKWFGVQFSVLHTTSGRYLHRSQSQPPGDEQLIAEMVRAVAGRSAPEFIAEEEPLLIIALPLQLPDGGDCTAVATFTTQNLESSVASDQAARLLGWDIEKSTQWINQQTPWNDKALLRLAVACMENVAAQLRITRLENEVNEVSSNLSSTYEEISLLYGITQNLRISSNSDELGRLALDWLHEVIPAKGLVIQYLRTSAQKDAGSSQETEASFLTCGETPLDCGQFAQLVESFDTIDHRKPLVINAIETEQESWQFPEIHQLILVPLAEGDHVFGWLAVFNQHDDLEFGTVEASLLGSVSAILSIHASNLELYRQQENLMADVVRALTSAIDAKDPYTCGHSDRVARISVLLAQQLGMNEESLKKIHMAGLLHDIGKIGIDDNVLRKPGRLTEAEYEHIKLHPVLGYKILVDLKHLEDLLPVVLHHHEEWDGTGYPSGLQAEEIPLMARIAAVADAHDAMSSDRPYRPGMEREKVDSIFRDGSGKQWDTQVIEAYFQVRDKIQAISKEKPRKITDDLKYLR